MRITVVKDASTCKKTLVLDKKMEVATKTKVSMTGIANNVYTSAGDASTFSEHEQMPENHFFHAKPH